MDTFSHTSNTQRENTNAIFTSEKLDKSDKLADALNDLTINDTKYYESNTATVSDAQSNITHNMESVTHSNNGNETPTNTSNGNVEQKLLSNQTIPVVILTMNPRIEQRTALIVVAHQTLLTPSTKEVFVEVASGGTWVNMTLQQVSRKGVDRSTPGDIGHAVSVEHATYPAIIRFVGT